MKRVSEHPEGYVVLQSHADEYKLEKEDTLNAFFPIDVDPDDFRNVFLVRDSDLRMLEEKDYFGRVTEKLTGLRSSEIDLLMKIIQRRGRLRTVSPDSALANSVDQGKVADKYRSAQRLIDEIRSLRESLAFERFDELTEELVDVRLKKKSLEKERERARAFQQRRQLERAGEALAELEELERTLEGLREVDYRKFKEWQRIAVEREHLVKEVERGEKAAIRLKKDRERTARELEALCARTGEADRRFRGVEKELSQRIDEYQHDRMEFRRWDTVSGLARKALMGSSVLLVIALIAYAFTLSNAIGVVGLIALALVLRTGWGLYRHRRARGELERQAEGLRTDAARFGLRVETVLELHSAIGDLEREVESRRDEERAGATAHERVGTDLESQEKRIETHRRRVGEIDAAVAEFKSATRTQSLDDFQAAIDRRRSAEASRRAQRELLKGLIPIEAQGDAATVDEWRAAIDAGFAALASMATADAVEKAVEEDEWSERSARVEREIGGLESRERDIADLLAKGGKQLYGVQMKAGELRVRDELPRCRTVGDLDHLSDRIADYCRRIEHDQSLAQQAIGVFLEIDTEERERVGQLFGPTAPVSKIFREITEGRYRSVTYDVDQDQVFVERSDDKVLRATALSGGAFDQLYLAIRLSVADVLLPASKGFFIMDDPFIKADANRLAGLMDTLRRFVEKGWQVIYFSAKQEVLDVLDEDIRGGRVQLIELGRTLFSSTTPPAPLTQLKMD
jgi:DNA repair exonuclease SbcCD ATPase subunit